jgi:hypothetical protein
MVLAAGIRLCFMVQKFERMGLLSDFGRKLLMEVFGNA